MPLSPFYYHLSMNQLVLRHGMTTHVCTTLDARKYCIHYCSARNFMHLSMSQEGIRRYTY